ENRDGDEEQWSSNHDARRKTAIGSARSDCCQRLAGAASEQFGEDPLLCSETGTILVSEWLTGIELHGARVARHPVHAELIVQVRTGRGAGAADLADQLTLHHRAPRTIRRIDPREMRLARGDAVAMTELYQTAGPARPAG